MFRNFLPATRKPQETRQDTPQARFDRLFDEFFSFPGDAFAPAVFSPAVDVHEDREGLHFRVELPGLVAPCGRCSPMRPGMDEKEIDVSVHDRVLTIKGERKEETTRKDGKSVISESRYGSFSRSFALPDGTDPGKIRARFEKGVLSVDVALPEARDAQSGRISIAVK